MGGVLRRQVTPGSGNGDCYDTATYLKMLVPLAVLVPQDNYYNGYMSPLSTLLSVVAMNQIDVTQAVRHRGLLQVLPA